MISSPRTIPSVTQILFVRCRCPVHRSCLVRVPLNGVSHFQRCALWKCEEPELWILSCFHCFFVFVFLTKAI